MVFYPVTTSVEACGEWHSRRHNLSYSRSLLVLAASSVVPGAEPRCPVHQKHAPSARWVAVTNTPIPPDAKSAGGRTARSALFQVEQYRTLDKHITGAGCYSLGAHTPAVRKLAPFVRATDAISSFVCLRGFSMATLFMYSGA